MSESLKTCPTCQTQNHHAAMVCITCGSDLSDVNVATRARSNISRKEPYDFRYGETDLLEGSLNRSAGLFTLGLLVVLLVLVAGGIGFLLGNGGFGSNNNDADVPPLEDDRSPTPSPTLNAATVTLGPPTRTPSATPTVTFTPSVTPTRGPCQYTIPPGGTLVLALINCGYQSQEIMPTVLALNNLQDANSVQANQTILVPWPTETPDPNALPTDEPTAEGGASNDTDTNVLELNESIVAFAATATPTLPPGVQWHQIGPEENIITVAIRYESDVKTLSELNREIDFARCDFGETFGGPECIVQLFQGQLIRVPAPTPTPTLSPTPDPNATATPTATPTVNVPNVVSPSNREFFAVDELVTLRWIPSATLRDGESYRVDVLDTTSGKRYTALTRDLAYIMPLEWQGTEQARHEYEWTVGIVNTENPDDIQFQTPPVKFVWQGQILPESVSSS